jgi:glyoxylase-like metal-dependent hydrolase (beta-lactamase superfamily II)
MHKISTTGGVSLIAILVAATLAACSKPAEAPVPPPAETTAAETPAPAAKAEVSYAFKIGDLSAIALSDGALEFPNDNKVFGLDRTKEDVASLLSAAGLPTDNIQLGLQPLLVKASDRVLLFDTGAGTNFGPQAGKLSETLAAANVDPQSVTDIFISHVHGDHVGGLVNAAGALNFPNATIHISEPEWKFLTSLSAEDAKMIGLGTRDAMVAAMKPKVQAFKPGADLVPGTVKAVDIKGHTPGHSAYKISSGAESLLYIGDSMHHSIISVQKADWPMGFDSDQKTGAASRAALVADLAKSGQRVYAVHFPFPGVGKIARRGEEFVWVAE